VFGIKVCYLLLVILAGMSRSSDKDVNNDHNEVTEAHPCVLDTGVPCQYDDYLNSHIEWIKIDEALAV